MQIIVCLYTDNSSENPVDSFFKKKGEEGGQEREGKQEGEEKRGAS